MSRLTLSGIVERKSGEKTYKVRVSKSRKHPKYQKRYTVHKNYLVHSEDELEIGSRVNIIECRKYSKLKSFKILEKKKDA